MAAIIVRQALTFERCSPGTKGPNVCQQNISHTINTSCVNCSFSFMFLTNRSGTQCDLLYPVCFTLQYAVFCIPWLLLFELLLASYHLKRSVRSYLTSGINEAFLPREFSLLQTVNPGDGCMISNFEVLLLSSKSLKSPFFCILMLSLNFIVVLNASTVTAMWLGF